MLGGEFIVSPAPGISKVSGGNFSGRSLTLRRFSGLPLSPSDAAEEAPAFPGAVYIGSEVYNALSGLSDTAADELSLHDPDYKNNARWHTLSGNDLLGPIFSSHPFLLSGGQQALLVVASSLLTVRTRFAIDTALEQLDGRTRTHLLAALEQSAVSDLSVGLADNRLESLNGWYDRAVAPLPVSTQRAGSDSFLRRTQITPDPILHMSPVGPVDVALTNIDFAYKHSSFALSHISCELSGGHTYALVGYNGAGKTTLAKLLAGILRPKSGHVYANNVRQTLWRAPGALFAYHFQNPDVQLFGDTVANEIALSRPAKDSKNVLSLLSEAFGLSEILEKHPLDLPFVLRKRIALSATIAQPTPWVILDEPTLGQDDNTVHALARLVRNLNSLGRGVIVISHCPHFLEKVGARPLYMSGGRLES